MDAEEEEGGCGSESVVGDEKAEAGRATSCWTAEQARGRRQ